MVLTHRIFIGLLLLVLVTCSPTTSIRRRHREATTPQQNVTTEEATTKTENVNPRRRVSSTTTTTPSTTTTLSTTTTTPSTTTSTASTATPTPKITRQATGRSLDITKEKYLAPEYHNNVFSESKVFEKEASSKPMEYEKMFDEIAMTTPKDDLFDHRHRQLEEELTKTMEEREESFKKDDYKTKHDEYSIKHDEYNGKHAGYDTKHDGYTTKDDEYNTKHGFDGSNDDFKTTPVDESQMHVRGYKQIDTSESRVKNKVHMDYNMEEGKKMDMLKSYNVTKVMPEYEKKPDEKNVVLESSETKTTKLKTEKPEDEKLKTGTERIETSTENPVGSTTIRPTNMRSRQTDITRRQTDTTRSQNEIIKTETTKPQSEITRRPIATRRLTSQTTTTTTTPTTSKPIRRTPTRYIRTRPTKKPLDLDQEPSIQIENVQIQEIDPSLAKQLNTTNEILTKEFPDPVLQTDKEILISKRGKTKQKTTPVDDLDELNVVEVTTTIRKGEVQSSTESVIKSQRIASLDMKTVDVVSSREVMNETTTKSEEVVENITLEVSTMIVDISTTEMVIETTTLREMEDAITTKDVPTTTEEVPTTKDGVSTMKDNPTTSEDIPSTTQETPTTTTQIPEYTTTEQPTEATTFVFDEDRTNFRDLMEEILTNSTEEPFETTTQFYEVTDSLDTTFYEVSTIIMEASTQRANDSNSANEIIKTVAPNEEKPDQQRPDEGTKLPEVGTNDLDNTTKVNDNDIIKQNEINVNNDKVVKVSTTEEPIERDCEAENCDEAREPEHDEDYIEGMPKKTQDDDLEESEKEKLEKFGEKVTIPPTKPTSTSTHDVFELGGRTTEGILGGRKVEDEEIDVDVTTIPGSLTDDEEDGGNGGKIAAIIISSVGGVCLVLLVGLLIIMRKRQKRFNYGQRCRPVSLDAYNMDNVSIHNSTRRKGVLMASKRSYGNPAFDDPNCPSHPLNYAELVKFAKNTEEVYLEFEKIPQVQAKTSELPEGCEAKNRYANVIPLPETRVSLTPIDGQANSDYINANYVTGAKGQRKYYIACQAPMSNTIEDFWRMIWEQECKVVLMLTHLYEQGVEKCIDYLPPSEVLDCHRLFGDFQITLKKREVRDKYIISSLQLKNMVSNSWRELTHMWYMDWPHKGVPDEANSMIRFLIEARSYVKSNENKSKEGSTSFINGSAKSISPVVVHCSPGTGRTGTVIACDIAIREFEMTRNVDIPRIVYKIRRDRASSVQTKDQYSYIYNVINLYATKLTGGAFDSF